MASAGSASSGSFTTVRTRFHAAIERGSSDSVNPIRRRGNTSSVNRKIALENSPTVRSLDWIRDGTDHDEQDVGQRRDHVEQRLEPAAHADRLQPRCADLLGQAGEPLGLALLGAVGLDQLHALEALVDTGGELTELVLRRLKWTDTARS